MTVSPEIESLVRWRDRLALDWHGDDLIFHVAYILRHFSNAEVPEEHKVAHQEFLGLNEDKQLSVVGQVLGWDDP